MRLFGSAIAIAAIALSSAPATAAVLVQYNFTGNVGNEVSEPAVNVAAGLGGLALSRGPGLTATTGAGSINSSSWSTDTSTDYYSFGFTVGAGGGATVNQLLFGSQSSGTGPGTINVLASIDNGVFTQVGNYSLQPATNFSQTLTFATPLTALNGIDFRLVAANNTNANGIGPIGAAGTFRVNNFDPGGANTPFTIDGSVSQASAAVPEPASWAMLIIGFGMAGAMVRRRSARVALA